MGKVNSKDLPEKQQQLGQFFTPDKTADFCLSHTEIVTPLVIEPSCGKGVFLDKIRAKSPNTIILGIELDEELEYVGEQVANLNFYDFDLLVGNDITFIGNPPYRTPACSLGDDVVFNRKPYLRKMCEKYGVTGIREEAVFFIIKSIDLILKNNVSGHIYYILPKTIFQNNSRSYKTFTGFLKNNVRLVSVNDIGQDFFGVTTDLCYVHFVVDGTRSDKFLWDGIESNLDSFYGVDEDLIPFQSIFKKTYLGSVPCESVLLSVKCEPREHFKERLIRLFSGQVGVMEGLSYQGEPHLRALKKGDINKLEVVSRYVEEIRRRVDTKDFQCDNFYKPIQHRHEIRFYFRHEALKKASFVYQLNPNPCRSFYFPGNPSKGCLDYHGFTDYDVNRNCSPSANRTVPVDGVENNLTDEFKLYWKETGRPYSDVFAYLSYILESDWYKDMKQKYQRFYFGIPREFDKKWLLK